jgi:hypothetical protein
MNVRRRSVLVTVAAVLMLLVGLLSATGVGLAVIEWFQTPRPPLLGSEARLQPMRDFFLLILFPVMALLLVSGGVALFFRWRLARSLATLAVLFAVFAPASLIVFELVQGGRATAQTAVVGTIWLIWVGFTLFSIWRPSAASEFS